MVLTCCESNMLYDAKFLRLDVLYCERREMTTVIKRKRVRLDFLYMRRIISMNVADLRARNDQGYVSILGNGHSWHFEGDETTSI